MGLMVLHRIFWRWFVSSRIWLLLPVIQVCSHLFLFAVVAVAFNRGFVSSSVLGFGYSDLLVGVYVAVAWTFSFVVICCSPFPLQIRLEIASYLLLFMWRVVGWCVCFRVDGQIHCCAL
jgi:hypothetical protein